MFLQYFDPSEVRAGLHVNRDRDRVWLHDKLETYLEADKRIQGRAFCVIGEKGVGKSILIRSVLFDLRQRYSGDTLFLEVDCRRTRLRAVLADVAQAALEELGALSAAGGLVAPAMLATAQLLATLTRYTEAELEDVHETIRQFSASASLAGERHLLKVLGLNFGISLQRDDKSIKALTGKVRFDTDRLCGLLCAFLRDLRGVGFRVLLVLDNVEELRHEYWEPEEILRVTRRDTEGLLQLREAPVGLVLSMRDYYSGILPRDISERRTLRRLAAAEQLEMLDARMEEEGAEARQAVDDVKDQVRMLAGRAHTPLAFLTWFKHLFEEGFLEANDKDRREEGLEDFLQVNYANLPLSTLRAVAALFKQRGSVVKRGELMAAVGGNEAVVVQLQSRQAVLPRDFWHPEEFTLDPELRFLLDAPGS